MLVFSPTLVRWLGKITTGTNEGKGAAFFPFLFVGDENYLRPWLINHERIHFRQQIETLIVGALIITFLERLYARLFLKMGKMERYLYAASEQEAYLNMDNPRYLESRPAWRLFHYLKYKRKFRLTGPGQIEFQD